MNDDTQKAVENNVNTTKKQFTLARSICASLILVCVAAPANSGYLDDLKKELKKEMRSTQKQVMKDLKSSFSGDSKSSKAKKTVKTKKTTSTSVSKHALRTQKTKPIIKVADSDSEIITDRADIKKAQQYLKRLGFRPGPADGLMGKRTRRAIAAFQSSKKLPVTRQLDRRTFEELEKAVKGSEIGTTGHAKIEPTNLPAPRVNNGEPFYTKTREKALEKLKVKWATDPWDKSRHSMFRLAEIHTLLETSDMSRPVDIIPKDAIPIKNREDLELLTENGVLIFYQPATRSSGFKQSRRLAHYGWNQYANGSKLYLNPKETRPFSRDIHPRYLEQCEVERDFSEPLVFCYSFYRDAVYPDIIYAQGMDRRAGINNGNAKRNQFIFQLTNEGSVDDLVRKNLEKYGENYQVSIPSSALMLGLLKSGQQVDKALRGSSGGSQKDCFLETCPGQSRPGSAMPIR